MNSNYLKVWFFAVAAALLAVGAAAGASETDNRIESSAKNSYVFKTYLQDDSIKTQSMDGVVTLTGTVREESHKSLAQETVASLPGVKSVDNQLELEGEQPAEYSDGWVMIKVKTALLFHRAVNGFKTEVDVKDGVVTLKGEALSAAQKELASEYAKDVAGVKDVRNEMTVSADANKDEAPASEENIDDASITAQVKVVLASHLSTSFVKAAVSTNAGIVTVSGVAGSEAEKTLVGKLAGDVIGVLRVVNDMTVVAPK